MDLDSWRHYDWPKSDAYISDFGTYSHYLIDWVDILGGPKNAYKILFANYN